MLFKLSNKQLNPSSVKSQFPTLKVTKFLRLQIPFEIAFIPLSPKGLFQRSKIEISKWSIIKIFFSIFAD